MPTLMRTLIEAKYHRLSICGLIETLVFKLQSAVSSTYSDISGLSQVGELPETAFRAHDRCERLFETTGSHRLTDLCMNVSPTSTKLA